MRLKFILPLTVLFLGAFSLPSHSDPALPRPEHPRPDAYRENWLNLNGEWQFEIDEKNDGDARGLVTGKDLSSKIIVPFCPESKLSGLGLGNDHYFEHCWYRRSFELPPAMQGQRILLHFGGVDYTSAVYVNGQLAGTHLGGSVAFTFEITPFLKPGANEIVLQVADLLRSGLQGGGKQSGHQSGGCSYTRTTGIWQTVWLEAVGPSYVEAISIITDPDHSRVFISADVNGLDPDVTLVAEAFADGAKVGSDSATGTWRNRQLVINLSRKKLWEPSSPFLYDLKFTLSKGSRKLDELKSYFGLRQVTIEGRRILINGKPVFQRLILDQGFYPDGVWTAPTDEALKHDIELSMAAGFNGARLHQKVFEPRFLYWADKLGYLVWGEYPSWGYDAQLPGYAPYINEWTEELLRDRNHPSIIGWCPFNESHPWFAEIQQTVWKLTKAIDPTRPALETSGWSHTVAHPEVLDVHDYESNAEKFHRTWTDYFTNSNPSPELPARYGFRHQETPSDRGVPFMISEIGGIGYSAPANVPPTDGAKDWSYGDKIKSADAFYARYQGTLQALLSNPDLFGFCYTQLTDIEQEKNGLYYYDRTPKLDVAKLHAITAEAAAYERNESVAPQPATQPQPKWKVLMGARQDGSLCTPWRFTADLAQATTAKEGQPGWALDSFDDAQWQSAPAPFGNRRDIKGTAWTGTDLYLRKTVNYDGGDLKNAAVVLMYNGDNEVYVNGRKILSRTGSSEDYTLNVVTDALRKALKKGPNTIAVHLHKNKDSSFLDLALLVD